MAGCMAACIMASSCKDEARGQVYDPNVPVTVTDFYPDSGGVATQMILNGSNFGTDLNNIQVYFNKKKAAVIGSLGDKLYVITPRRPGDGMPDDGDPDHDQVDITVQVGEQSATYNKKFNYHIQTLVSTCADVRVRQRLRSVRWVRRNSREKWAFWPWMPKTTFLWLRANFGGQTN